MLCEALLRLESGEDYHHPIIVILHVFWPFFGCFITIHLHQAHTGSDLCHCHIYL